MRFRILKIRNSKIVADDNHFGNSANFVASLFDYCNQDTQARLAGWLKQPQPHYIRFVFPDFTLIIITQILDRTDRIKRQRWRRPL